MSELRVEGVWTALVTPFTDDGSAVDVEALRTLVEAQIAAGVDVLVPCGTTGESPTLSHAEHDQVVELVVQFAAGRVPVVAGTGSNSTREALRLTRHAADVGADGALVVTPYYNRPSQRMLRAHYATLAEAVDLPLVLYDVPSRTGVRLELGTVAALHTDHANVVALKAANGSAEFVRRLCEESRIGVLSGDDNLTVDMLRVGARGVVSVASNILPERIVRMVRLGLDGDLDGAQRESDALAGLFEALFVEPNPVPVKAARALLGQGNDVVRAPLLPAEEATRDRLRHELGGASGRFVHGA